MPWWAVLRVGGRAKDLGEVANRIGFRIFIERFKFWNIYISSFIKIYFYVMLLSFGIKFRTHAHERNSTRWNHGKSD